MAGSPLEVFNDFMLSTGPAIYTGPEDVINEATKNTYILSRFLRGKDMSETVQGGSKIRDQIFFDEQSTFQNYQPNERMGWESTNVLAEWEIPWRFSMAHMSWTDQEIGLNTSGMSKQSRFHKYKALKRTKEQNLGTTLINGLEEQLWATPDAAGMESAGGTVPYSIAALVNEHAVIDPIWDAVASTVQGINPTSQAKWRNQRGNYAAVETQSAAIAASKTHLFQAFDSMWEDLRFEELPVYTEFGERKTNPGFIAASKLGVTQYQNALRVNQDWFRYGGQDPAYPHPMYRNVDVIRIAELETAELYTAPDGTGYATEAVGTVGGTPSDSTGFEGARYYFINGRYLKKTIHSERYFHKIAPFKPSAQPTTTVCPVDIWHNNNARSLRRLGIVSPSEDI